MCSPQTHSRRLASSLCLAPALPRLPVALALVALALVALALRQPVALGHGFESWSRSRRMRRLVAELVELRVRPQLDDEVPGSRFPTVETFVERGFISATQSIARAGRGNPTANHTQIIESESVGASRDFVASGEVGAVSEERGEEFTPQRRPK